MAQISGTDTCATLGYQRSILFGGAYRYYYYQCDCEDGSTPFLKWRVTSFSESDSATAIASVPSGWISYELPCIIEDFETLGTWTVAGDVYPLKARYFGDSLYLTQSVSTSPDVFVVRRYTFLGNSYEDIDILRVLEDDCEDLWAGGDDGTGGYTEPEGFTTPSGYTLYYASDSTKVYYENGSTPDSDVGNNLIAIFTPTTVPDSVNLTQFDDIAQKDGLVFSFGQGSPYFAEQFTYTPALQLKKGWDKTYNGAFASGTSIPSSRLSGFYDATGMWAGIANEIKGTYPDLANVTLGPSPNLSAVSRNSALELGRTSWWYRYNATSNYSGIPDKKFSMMTLDEEIWNYPTGQHLFVGGVLYGMRQGAIASGVSNPVIHLYGNNYAPTNFRLGATAPYPEGESQSTMNTYASTFRLHNSDYYASGAYVDFGVMYYKTPIPDTETYYQKSGGSYVLDGSGKRQFRTDAFTDDLFGTTTNFYQTNTATYLANVSSDHATDSVNRRHDVYWAIEQQYRHHDMIQLGLKARATAYGHGGDITYKYDEGLKPYALIRLETEPYTVGGNGHDIRELGEAGVLSVATITGMSGLWGFDTWQDGSGSQVYPGRDDSTIDYAPNNGDSLYNKSGNYARFEAATAAIQGIKKAYNGIDFGSNFRYFHWSKYYDSFVNKEILSNGFYDDDKLGVYFMYPYHDPTDTTEVTVQLGDNITKTFDLVGRKPVIYQWDIDNTVTPDKLVLSYTNIDGNLISVTGNIEDRYNSGGIVDTGQPDDEWATTVSIGSYGYSYGSSYTSLAAELAGGVNIFNYHGNLSPNNNYPAAKGSSDPIIGYTDNYSAVMWPSHSHNYKYATSGADEEGLISKVHYKVIDKSNGQVVLEVYDTKGSTPSARANNHPDDTRRWLRKGNYTIWVKNISGDDGVVQWIRFGTTQDTNGDSIYSSTLTNGNEVSFDVTIGNAVNGIIGHLYKFNVNTGY
ncbi:MAG: hypothetical protein NXI00_21235 [Cytophagales bacterium]|nr:hypothetical protein [Cytophagales bacterium]